MQTLDRIRGDNYPIEVLFSVDEVAIDLTGAVVSFSYQKENEAISTIIGVATAEKGVALFTPSTLDFQTAGSFRYDIQRVQGGFTYTHSIGALLITEDISP